MTHHAIKRCRERYGLHLSREGIENLKAQVASGKAVLMGSCNPESPSIKSYMAKIGGVVVRFIYDAERKSIPTVLPKDGPMRLNNRPRRK